MTKPPKAFDVWFMTANTVYKAVPYGVVADWTQEGRLAATDKVRPTGTNTPWIAIGDYELLADYVPHEVATAAVAVDANPATQPAPTSAETGAHVELPEPEEMHYKRPASEEDDDVDMIPLIDVSMVLLVFFIIMRAAGAVSPVDVPEMRYGGELRNDPEAITISIDKQDEFKVIYSVRVGASTPKPEHDGLATPEDAVRVLDQLLLDSKSPPEVRIACRKDLPRERVYELRRELEGRLKNQKINSFTATVMEAPKKE